MASQPINLQDAGVSAQPAQPAQTPSSGGGFHGFLHGLLSAASGLPSTTPSIDPTTGQTVNTPVQHSTGDMFKSMFAGMLTGLAGGVRANQSGAHGALGAIGGGFNAETQALQQRDALARQNAQKQFQDQQAAMKNQDQHKLNQLAMIQANQDIAANSLKAARLKVQMSEEDADRLNKFQEQVSAVPGATYAGFHSSLGDLMNDPNKAELMKQHAGGTLISTPVMGKDQDGNPVVTGFESYIVPKSYLDSPTSEPTSWTQEKPGKDGKVQYEQHSIPAGAMTNRDAMLLQQKQLSGLITPKDQYEQGEANKRLQFTQEQENTRQERQLTQQAKLAEESKEGKELAPDDVDHWARLLKENRVSLNSLRYLQKFTNFGQVAEKLGPDWNENAYAAGLKQKEYYTSGKGAQTILGGSNAIQHLATADNILSKLSPDMSDVKSINKAISYWGRQLGQPDIVSIDTLAQAIAPELGKNLAGGKPDKDAVEKFEKLFTTDAGIRGARAAVREAASVVHQNLGSTAGVMQSSIPNVTSDPFSPNIARGAEQALHHFGYDNPLNFGGIPRVRQGESTVAPKYVSDQAVKTVMGGATHPPTLDDLNKAWALMQKAGWTGVQH